jgi:hypothetical protein
MPIANRAELEQTVRDVVRRQPVTDIHTHLYSPNMGGLLLWGVDELLTYHYLVAEVMRWSDVSPDVFFAWDKRRQADLIWQTLFVERSPLSEAQLGVLTSLQAFGADAAGRDLGAVRAAFAGATAEQHVDRALELANIDHVVMTNDPFDETERAFWLSGGQPDPRFHAVLRIDPLVRWFADAIPALRGWGYQAQGRDAASVAEVRRFLRDWIARIDPLYLAASLPPEFAFPDDSDGSHILEHAILPVCREAGLPFAMMIGSRRQINPALRLAGDGLGRADLSSVARLARDYPGNKFLVTVLSRENQHELAVLARKFRNLMVFGCWWFVNNPVLIEEITRMRLEMLGTSFIPQHSDARVLDQVVYKWAHSRDILARVLVDRYAALQRTGWQVARADVERDVADLLSANFWRFVGR